MSYIFDRFPTRAAAAGFHAAAYLLTGELPVVFDDQRQADAHDPFPGELTPPIVHVDRDDEDTHEAELAELAESFGGRYAGT